MLYMLLRVKFFVSSGLFVRDKTNSSCLYSSITTEIETSENSHRLNCVPVAAGVEEGGTSALCSAITQPERLA